MLAVAEIPVEVQIAIWVAMLGAIGFGFVLDLKVTQRITKLEVKMEMAMSIVSKKFAGLLHSPHTPELDGYIEAFQADTLKAESVDRFLQMLHEIEIDMKAPRGERAIALITSILVCRKFNRPIPSIDPHIIGEDGK